jgi:hypothetical protein
LIKSCQTTFATFGACPDIDTGKPLHHGFQGLRTGISFVFVAILGQLPDQSYVLRFIPGGQKSEVPDFLEPLGQNMEQEPSDEFNSIKGHFFGGIVLCPVFPGKYYFTFFKGFDSVI